MSTLKPILRVAARKTKEEALKELMMKLRKGAGTSLKVKQLVPVLDYLGGWLIEDTIVLVAESRSYSDTSEADVRTYTNSNPGNVQAVWDKSKAQEVSKLPDPEQAKLHHTYYMDVSDIETLPSGQTGFQYKAWQASLGTLVKAPNGKSITISKSVDRFLDSYPSNEFDFLTKERVSDWLQKSTPFLKQINEKLDLPSFEVEKQNQVDKRREELKEISRTKENIGECPVCEGMFRLLPKTREGKDKSMPGMVLHGYKRPGIGYIHSNCPGEFWPPFELSPEGTVYYLALVKKSLSAAEDRMKALERDEVEVLYGTPGKQYKKSEMDPRDWAEKYEAEVASQKKKVVDIKKEVETLKKKISGWKHVPLNLTF